MCKHVNWPKNPTEKSVYIAAVRNPWFVITFPPVCGVQLESKNLKWNKFNYEPVTIASDDYQSDQDCEGSNYCLATSASNEPVPIQYSHAFPNDQNSRSRP